MSPEDRTRWNLYMTQALRFEEKEAYVDAVARARLAQEEIESALRGASGATARKLQRRLERVSAQVERMDALRAEWNQKIADRRYASFAGAAEEMKRELPKGPETL